MFLESTSALWCLRRLSMVASIDIRKLSTCINPTNAHISSDFRYLLFTSDGSLWTLNLQKYFDDNPASFCQTAQLRARKDSLASSRSSVALSPAKSSQSHRRRIPAYRSRWLLRLGVLDNGSPSASDPSNLPWYSVAGELIKEL